MIDGNIVNLYETGEKELKNIFLSEVLGMSVREYHLIWARHLFSGRFKQHTKLYSDNDIIAAVNANPGSIGYVFEDSVQEISHVLFYFDPASSHGIKVN
ncbi:MAG: hypothetical protein JKY67_12240 [Pseudomonadales bacterium]|nr:hypothetical protein [Pseudomonadales bacterium]